jgi:hypothetical protein
MTSPLAHFFRQASTHSGRENPDLVEDSQYANRGGDNRSALDFDWSAN